MADIEVHIELGGAVKRVGVLHRQARRGGEAVAFQYHPDWLTDPDRFSLEPALTLGGGAFSSAAGLSMFGSLGDSAPDTWGRRLMQRAERRRARREGRAVRTLSEADYLLGVADISRMGALRFRPAGGVAFEAATVEGVPDVLELGRLLAVTERIFRDEETDEDLRMIFAPGSSLGGARPKASVIDARGRLSIAKFPKPDDDYGVELWESVALRLAGMAGVNAAEHHRVDVAGRPVLLSRRFDRDDGARVPFLSALSMMGLRDGDRGSYPELVDMLARHGAHARRDAAELYRRMTLNVLISNVDDHLRNHGFLWRGGGGWTLSPAYDLNPIPSDLKAKVLSTNIDLDDGACDIDLVLSVAPLFDLPLGEAREIIRTVAGATRHWRDVAAEAGARPAEIRRMESAFEHEASRRAQAI